MHDSFTDYKIPNIFEANSSKTVSYFNPTGFSFMLLRGKTYHRHNGDGEIGFALKCKARTLEELKPATTDGDQPSEFGV